MKQVYNLKCCYAVFGLSAFLICGVARSEDENYLTSLTTVGSTFISQFLGINGRFPKVDDRRSDFFALRHDAESEKERLAELGRKTKPSPLTWNLGIAYTNLRSPAEGIDPSLNESILSGQLGIGWKFSTEWQINLSIGLDGNGYENYGHGFANFRFEYFFPLHSNVRTIQDEKPVSENDASEYYQSEREKKMKSLEKQWRLELLESDEQELNENRKLNIFPQIRIAYNFGFNSHTVDEKEVRVPSKKSVTSQNMRMYQYQYGPEITYSPKLGDSYKFMISYFTYNNDVDQFVSLLDIGNVARYPIFPSNGISVSANQLFSYPSWFFGTSGSWRLDYKSFLELNLGLTTYSASNQTSTYAINPVYIYNFKRKFQFMLGAGFVFGTNASLISSVVGLNIKL